MYYRLGRAGKALDRFGVIEFATTIAPGVRDVLLSGKVYEAVERNSRNKGAIEYDAVVLDAPPTGRISQLPQRRRRGRRAGEGRPDQDPVGHDDEALPVSAHGCAPGHPARGDAGPGDHRRHRRAERAKLPVGGVVVNMVRPRDLSDEDLAAARAGTLDRDRVESEVKAAGIEVDARAARRTAARGRRARGAAGAGGRPAAGGRRPRRADLRAAPDGGRRRPRARSTSSPDCCASREWHDGPD